METELTSQKRIEDMTNYEMSRWISLMQSIEGIDMLCEKKGIDFETMDIKTIPIQKYINSTARIHEHNLMKEAMTENKKIINRAVSGIVKSTIKPETL